MIGGTGKVSKSFKLLTGIGAATIVAVNPTNDQYEKISGAKLPYELNYDKYHGEDNITYQPLVFMMHNKKESTFDLLKLRISNDDDFNRAGDKVQSIDPAGNIGYVATDGSTNYTWMDAANSRPLKKGEAKIHELLQTYVKYDKSSSEAQWLIDLASAGVTSDKLFAGDTSGITALINWANKQTVGNVVGHSIGLLYSVRKSPKKSKEDGSEIPGEYNYNQNIESSKFFFTDVDGEVSKSAYKNLKSFAEKQEEAGYKVTNNLYTYKLQEFSEEHCENTAPKIDVVHSETSTKLNW